MIGGQSIFDLLHEPKFHCLVFSDQTNHADELKKIVADRYGDMVEVQSISLTPEATEAFGQEKSFAMLVRPDNYIGRITSDTSEVAVTSYLDGLSVSDKL
jgi:hypothetical protein